VNVGILPDGSKRFNTNGIDKSNRIENLMDGSLKLGVVQGVQACNLGVTLLAEELERDAAA
jgi:hypothetical protein